MSEQPEDLDALAKLIDAEGKRCGFDGDGLTSFCGRAIAIADAAVAKHCKGRIVIIARRKGATKELVTICSPERARWLLEAWLALPDGATDEAERKLREI